MAIRKPTERTNKFLEITDPKKAVGLWSYYAVRETAITPVGNTFMALGRFLPEDIARWKRRDEMGAAMVMGKGKGVKLPSGKIRFHSPAQIISKYQEKCKQDERRMPLVEWRTKYRWLFMWQNYACRLASAAGEANEPDVHMFFNAPSAGITCHEGELHSGRVFFLRTKLPVGLNADRLRDTQSFDRIGAATTARVESSSSVAPTPQLDSVEGSSHPKNASGSFPDSGVGSEATVVAGSENDLLSRSAQADCVQKPTYKYFVAVVLKPGGTKWWSQIDKTNVTWTDNVYDRLIIDPRGGLSWSPILAEVINERVHEKDICLFMLDDDPLFKAITDNELNPNEKYAHLCYAFDFFCKDAESDHRSFYLRWSVFFNPKKGKFDAAHKSKPRVIEVFGERKKGWVTRRIEVNDFLNADRLRDTQKEAFSDVATTDRNTDPTPQSKNALSASKENVANQLKYASGKRKPLTAGAKEAGALTISDAKLGLGDTPLDKYAQDVAQWVATNNGCAVLPIGVSREMRLALSHALYFVTFPDRKPDEPGGILRGYQLPGRLVEHAPGKVRGDNSKAFKERSKKQSEEAITRRRKMVVDCFFTRACAAVAVRNRNALNEQEVVRRMEEVGARATLEKAAWQLGCMTGNPLMLFKPGPTAGNLKLPDLSLALCFEQKLGLKGETAGDEMVVQTAPIRTLKDSQGAIRVSLDGAYPCRSVWTPSPGKEKGNVAYPSDSVRIIRDDTGYYLMAVPKYGQYHTERDLAFEPDVPGKPRYKGLGIRDQGLGKGGVPVCAYSVKSVGGVRSRADSFVVEEVYEFNKLMKLARDGRIYLYAIDFGRDKWLADLVYSTENKRPCKVVPTIPILANEGVAKDDALEDSRKNGSDMKTKVPLLGERCNAYITFTFNPTVARENRKVEGRSWKSYCDAFPAEAQRTIIRWPDSGTQIANAIRNKRPFSDVATTGRNTDPTPQSENGQLASLEEALQKVIETDGVLLTDKEHIDEAIRAATYVVPRCGNWAKRSCGVARAEKTTIPSAGVVAAQVSPNSAYAEGICVQNNPNAYKGYILKDRVFKDSDGRVEWRETQELSDTKENIRHREFCKKRFRELKGKPLCEVLSPDLAKAAEVEFTRQIEADTLVGAKTSEDFKLEKPIRVGEDFKEAVAREFRRIAYTGTMGWRKKLNRPAHEVAIGIWLAGLKPDSGTQVAHATREKRPKGDVARGLAVGSADFASLNPTRSLRDGRISNGASWNLKSNSDAPTPQSSFGQLASEGQKKRLKTLDALLAEGLVTQEEYAAKKAEILGA